MKKLKVAVTSGYGSSKHAIALLHGISALPEVEVVLLLQVEVFSISRVRQLIRMHGVNNAWNKFKNIFFANQGNPFAEETMAMEKYLNDAGIKTRTTREACRYLNINFKKVKSLNDTGVEKMLHNYEADVVVYAGGGILRNNFIKSVPYGVVNAHSGPLPFFRGMNCLEWSLLHGVQTEITIHLIDGGIDTGPILKRVPWKMDTTSSILALRGKSVVVEVLALLEVLKNFEKYFNDRKEQAISDGVQFFTMHDHLKQKINQQLLQGWWPVMGMEEFVKQKKEH